MPEETMPEGAQETAATVIADTAEVPADEVIVAAVGLARSALEEVTPAATIGEPAGHTVEGEHVVSLLFECLLDGYSGWRWTATLARLDGESEPTVLETELMPGEGSLLAPDWVPWAERLAKIQAAQDGGADVERASDGDEHPGEDDDDDEEELDDEDIDEDDDIDGVDIDELAPPELEVAESDESEPEADDGAPEDPGEAGAEDEALDHEKADTGEEPAG